MFSFTHDVHSLLKPTSMLRHVLHQPTHMDMTRLCTSHYPVFLSALQCPYVCHLLYLLTRKEDVKYFRVRALLQLQQKMVGFYLAVLHTLFHLSTKITFWDILEHESLRSVEIKSKGQFLGVVMTFVMVFCCREYSLISWACCHSISSTVPTWWPLLCPETAR